MMCRKIETTMATTITKNIRGLPESGEVLSLPPSPPRQKFCQQISRFATSICKFFLHFCNLEIQEDELGTATLWKAGATPIVSPNFKY